MADTQPLGSLIDNGATWSNGPVLMDWEALELVTFPAHSKLRSIPPSTSLDPQR